MSFMDDITSAAAEAAEGASGGWEQEGSEAEGQGSGGLGDVFDQMPGGFLDPTQDPATGGTDGDFLNSLGEDSGFGDDAGFGEDQSGFAGDLSGFAQDAGFGESPPDESEY